ncbi:MAG: hypothetical protein OQK25_07895 [Gammaproteobacteria bacterium]|nr:hypothetical protein [Gammaproteobacteria bacterium]MCW8982485.1 hypothetical protein [Gammaproteobacteria bacterium]
MKLTLADTASGYDLTPLNNNFSLIENEFQDKVLYRDNPDGEPNQMEQSLDMNDNTVYNLPDAIEATQAAPWSQIVSLLASLAGNGAAELPHTRFTASSGQTVFTISEFSNEVGSNTLSVYINGVRQRVNIDYTETDSSTITFGTGLVAGDAVDFYKRVAV